MIEVLKTCSVCGIPKELDQFSICRAKKWGRQSRCKQCVSDLFPGYYKENKEKYLQRLRDWRAKQKEIVID